MRRQWKCRRDQAGVLYPLCPSSSISLLQYHQQCRTRAVEAMESLTWIPGDKIPGSYAQYLVSVTCMCECELKRTGLFSPRMQQHAYIPSWVREYLHQCEVVLAETPHWESVLDPRLLTPSILMAADCEQCKSRVIELHDFSRKLSRRVQIVIAEVSFSTTHTTMDETDALCLALRGSSPIRG